MDLTQHYTHMWDLAISKFQKGGFKYDDWIDNSSDNRLGITLIYRPNNQIIKNIQQFLSDTKSIIPNQYFYPPSDIHMTVMSIISCYDGFQLKQIHIDEYLLLLKECLQQFPPFSIHFRGLTASDSCIMVQGFPENSALNDLRNKIRDKFKKSTLENSLDKRYVLQTAHMTILRFKQPILNPSTFIKQIKKYQQYDFGKVEVDSLELVFNDWYMRKEKVKSLHFFNF